MPGSFVNASLRPIRTLWEFLDVLCFFLSPLAIIGFIVFAIIALDGFGEHVQMLRALEQSGIETSGAWSPPSAEGGLAYVRFDKEENGQSGVVLYTKYYSKKTLAGLKDGQAVRVRYVYPPQHETAAVLASEYGQVKGYTGYITGLFWPLLFCWLVVVIHPEFLYLGFTDPFAGKHAPSATEQQP